MTEQGVTAERLNWIMDKIQKLLAKAEGTNNEYEAAAFRAHAEKLMRDYRLAEEDLVAEDPMGVLPIFREIVITEISSKFYHEHYHLWGHTARHTGVRWTYKFDGPKIVAQIVGYSGDIRYAEFLHNAARLVMIAKLEPTVDPSKPDEDNVYALRSAGIERPRIAEMMGWGATGHGPIKVSNVYKKACAARGEDPTVSGRQVSAKTFREVYAREFTDRYAQRLREMRDAADSTGGMLVLHGRAERVDEAFYNKFPNLRPKPASTEPTQECQACKRRKDGTRCRKHRYTITKADLARYDRQYLSASAVAATAAGRSAADSVQLQRGHERARRVEESPNNNGLALPGE